LEFICKDYYTALYSLSQVIDVPQNEIVSVLEHNWANIYELEYTTFIQNDLSDEMMVDDFGEYILLKGFSKDKITNIRPTVHWFHGTRAINIDGYLKYGILPLSITYSKIKNIIDYIASAYGFNPSENTSEFQQQNKWLTEIKLKDSKTHGGPFAMLMYEAVAMPKMFGNHSYIDEPEIISNYAYMTYDKNADTILAEYRRISYPIIIEFTEPTFQEHTPLELLVTTVIKYLYHIIHNDELGINCNICFSNDGKIVPPELIVQIYQL